MVIVVLLLTAVAGGTEEYQIEETPIRNVSVPAFPVTGQPGTQQQQQQLPADRHLERTSEVENIPQQLSVTPPQHNVLNYQR